MFSGTKRRLAIATIALAVAAFAGGAYAATQSSSTNPRQAFLNDLAKRLGVSPSQLNSAMVGAFLDQLNAAVASGRITQAQANAIKQRIESGKYPLGGFPFLRDLARPGPGGAGAPFGPPGPAGPGGPGVPFGPPGRPGGAGPLAAAAAYLGLSPAQLFDQLRSGKSLAQVAAARSKPASGLKAAILAAEHKRLDAAVADKRITSSQEKQILGALLSRIDQLVNRSGPGRGFGGGFAHPGFRPLPGQAPPGAGAGPGLPQSPGAGAGSPLPPGPPAGPPV